jgi:CheY-like chemotaxis protein
MGGEIGVDSVEHAGSTFWFVLPFTECADEKKEGQDGDSPAVETVRPVRRSADFPLLVAEDNTINQMVIGEILQQSGFAYEIVSDGLEAVEAFEKKRYSLILMDCQMPNMDGFDATKKIREIEKDNFAPGRRRIPIIALTANATKRDEEKCLEVGMDTYCSKPINIERLIASVNECLSAT